MIGKSQLYKGDNMRTAIVDDNEVVQFVIDKLKAEGSTTSALLKHELAEKYGLASSTARQKIMAAIRYLEGQGRIETKGVGKGLRQAKLIVLKGG